MPRLTQIKRSVFEKFLVYVGCIYDRQEGDHKIYKRSDLKRPVVIPIHKEIPAFVVRNNLRTLGMSTSRFLSILNSL